MLREASRFRTDRVRRWKLQVVSLSLVAAIIFFVIGAGFAVAGSGAIAYSPTYHYLLNCLPDHSIRIHGVIMCTLAAGVLIALPEWTRVTRWLLTVMGWYAIVSACLLFESWFFAKIDWSTPWWYLLAGGICIELVRRGPNSGPAGGAEGSDDV